ncbi:MAG: iron-containing alcohol dehydrogenase [Spirochaetales bacterium]
MVGFEWELPTKIIFGEGCLTHLGTETKRWGRKVLFVYGHGLFKTGVEGASVPNHMLEHPLSGLYDLPHGAGLSIIIPAWLKYHKQKLVHRLVKFGKGVFDLPDLSEDLASAEKVIGFLVAWYRKIGTPTTLQEANLQKIDVEACTAQALELCRLWGIGGYTEEDIRSIYHLTEG